MKSPEKPILNSDADQNMQFDEQFSSQMARQLAAGMEFGTEKKHLYNKEYFRERNELSLMDSKYYQLSASIASTQGNREEWFVNTYIARKLEEIEQKNEPQFDSMEAYEQAINNLKARAQELWSQLEQEKDTQV